MRTNTQKLMLRGGLLVVGALLVSGLGGWARRATADAQPAPVTAPAVLAELRSLQQQRATAIIEFSSRYKISADLAAAIYDVALPEGVDPDLAFRLVKVESNFTPRAKSRVGAIGLTQVLPSTARLYEPGLTVEQLYDRDTNLRVGFRYLRDLLERYDNNLERALLAYNRGPGKVEELIGAGKDPRNGYSTSVMRGYRR